MNVLIVYAHPEPESFNGALKDLAVAALTEEGHLVQVSDLYAMKFKAAADRDDFLMPVNPDFFKYQLEQGHASRTNTFSPDIKEEQEKLLWADFVIFQFPLWWYSVPAILKGWFDRVFASGFVYGFKIFPRSLLFHIIRLLIMMSITN
ncbi:NAD(P)H-dependent oxidoreductase [Paenibacillus rhizophilus]|uniref:NAD(P)H-dependent oxidoreductase n=1 Tax=Paenibacillus rhizophilus TaxID=1850366 RepID=UPI001FE568DA|nr:NAD(P)H-dependent oxidoreductase [Paenibacillus rhizophilus]